MLKNCTKIIYIKNKFNKGYPKAINQGIKISLLNNKKYFLITNNDIVFYESTIDNLIKAARETKYGYITAVDEERGLRHITSYYSDVLCNSCFLIKQSVVNKIGYYDEHFGLGGEEDRDYIERMGRVSIERKSVITALVNHKHGLTQCLVKSNSLDKLRKNREYYEKKHNIKAPWKFD